jgi:hypothetical protein
MADVCSNLRKLGFHVDFATMSNHAWVVNKTQFHSRLINLANWDHLSIKELGKIWEGYKELWTLYDGFINSYPPSFSAIYEDSGKPIINVLCTRYEFPMGSGKFGSTQRLADLDRHLKEKAQDKLYFISNNKFDQHYFKDICGIDARYIRSTCDYVQEGSWIGTDRQAVIWHRAPKSLVGNLNSPFINSAFDISQKYDRTQLTKCRAIVHIPYNLSIMSAFEHYAMGIPMIVPSPNLLWEWWETKAGVLSEVFFPNTSQSFELKREHLDLSDWYSPDVFPGILRFDSLRELEQLLSETNFSDVSKIMRRNYALQSASTLDQWKDFLNCVF